MISEKKVTDYWFKIEPYVHISITDNCVLFYNTLDGVYIESDKIKAIELIKKTLHKTNYGVILLTSEQYQQKDINNLINELRNKYMADLIDVDLSKGKPIQILPLFNLYNIQELFKKHNFSSSKNILEYLSEVSIYVDHKSNITDLISFLKSLPIVSFINIIGNLDFIVNQIELLSFLRQLPSSKNIICSYANISSLRSNLNNNFSYQLSVNFPVDVQQLNYSNQIRLNQALSFEYIFEVSSLDDYQEAENFVEQYQIEKYQLKPKYNKKNINFFKTNIFLTKEDILSIPMSINDFFANKSINIYDFGKISITSNGNIYANIYHPSLGNIQTHSIYEIISKEIQEGKSWFRIRNQDPCSSCIYQWHCPSPSNFEIMIGQPNLCHVKL